MNYIGMDIHKKFTVAVVKDEKGNKLAEEKFENDEFAFIKFFAFYSPQDTKIVIESTCVWEYIYEIPVPASLGLCFPMPTYVHINNR